MSGIAIVVILLIHLVAGMVGHLISEHCRRPVWEPWLLAAASVPVVMAAVIFFPAKGVIVVAALLLGAFTAHYVAAFRGRPLYEPWTLALAVSILVFLGTSYITFVMIILAAMPPICMFTFAPRHIPGTPLVAPCPHCKEDFVVDARYGGKPVTCPNCKQLFLGPKVIA